MFPLLLDYAFHFPVKGVDSAVKITNMQKLTDFTICLWMSSSNTKGSLFSYAVSDSDNELLIFYDRYFQMDIGGESRLRIYMLFAGREVRIGKSEVLYTAQDGGGE